MARAAAPRTRGLKTPSGKSSLIVCGEPERLQGGLSVLPLSLRGGHGLTTNRGAAIRRGTMITGDCADAPTPPTSPTRCPLPPLG